MKKSVLAVGALAFVGASVAAIVPASAITFWLESPPFGPHDFPDTSTTIVGDFAAVRVTVLGGGLFAFVDNNKGAFVNAAEITCNTGTNSQQLSGNTTFNGNITLVCPVFGSTSNGQGSIESD